MNLSLERLFLALGLAGLMLVAGCAHRISFAPDPQKIVGSGAPRIEKAVAYQVSADDLQREVTTSASWRDRASYRPYRELDAAIGKALSQVFSSVTRLDQPFDPRRPPSPVPQLVFVPRIVTTSSSPAPVAWPITDFTLELGSQVLDGQGKALGPLSVTGTGQASFDELRSDPSLAARRAAEDAVMRFVQALETTPELRRPAQPAFRLLTPVPRMP